MDEGGAGGDRPHRREADGGRCRVMGEGSRWDLGQVAQCVVEGRRSRRAYGSREAGERNVISVLCLQGWGDWYVTYGTARLMQ